MRIFIPPAIFHSFLFRLFFFFLSLSSILIKKHIDDDLVISWFVQGTFEHSIKQLVSSKWIFSVHHPICIYIYIHACTFSYRLAQETYIETERGISIVYIYKYIYFFFKESDAYSCKQAVIQEVSRLHLERSKKRL